MSEAVTYVREQRLVDGTLTTVYRETDAASVLTADGSTAEAKIAALEAAVAALEG